MIGWNPNGELDEELRVTITILNGVQPGLQLTIFGTWQHGLELRRRKEPQLQLQCPNLSQFF